MDHIRLLSFIKFCLLTSLAWGLCNPLWSQPDFVEENLFRIGDTGEFRAIDPDSVDPTPTGNSRTWDFSSLTLKPEDDYQVRHLPPSGGPNVANYPNTQIVAIRTDRNDTEIDYIAFQFGRPFILAIEASSTGTYVFQDVSFIANFPITFGTTRVANIEGTYDFTGNQGVTGQSELEGTTTMTYDGFGSLLLPSGLAFDPVRRIKFVREWTEESTIAGTRITTQQKETRYVFYEGNHSVPAFEWIEVEQEVTPEGGETTMNVTRRAGFRFSSESIPQVVDRRRGPHLTRPNGAFDSQIIAHNPTSSAQTFQLHPLGQQGETLQPIDIQLAAGATSRSFAGDLFPTTAVSFFTEQCDSCIVSTGYRANIPNPSTAQVHQTRDYRKVFTFYPGEWQFLFDGQAIINSGTEPTKIKAIQVDYEGNSIGATTLNSGLAPDGKHLSLVNDLFFDRPQSLIRLEADQPIGVMVLRISKDFRFLYQNNPLPAAVDNDAGRWLAHVTSDQGGFDTDILVHNRGQDQATVTLLPFDASGQALTPVEVQVAAGNTQRSSKADLLPALTSHFSVMGSSDCIVSVGYRAQAANASTAFVHEAPPIGNSFSIFPGEWDILFDGLALVNTGSSSARISIQQIGDDGQILNDIVLVESLSPNAKHLALLENLLSEQPNSRLLITADQPLALLALRLSKDNLFLYNNEPIP